VTALVRIVDEPWADRVGIYLIHNLDGGIRILERPGHPEGTVTIDPAVQPLPSLRLDNSMARALMDALAQHFGRVTDSTGLRADYDAERARVDRLTTALITAHTDQAAAERSRLDALRVQMGMTS
jgi:hypothetical protein